MGRLLDIVKAALEEEEPSKPSKDGSEAFEGSNPGQIQDFCVAADQQDRRERPKPALEAILEREKSEISPEVVPPLGRLNDQGELVLPPEDLAELERHLRSYGWQVEQLGDQLICRKRLPRSRRKAKGKNANTQQLEPTARNVTAMPVLPAGPCYACKGAGFWISAFGVVTCAGCHPPANDELVREWYRLPECACELPAVDVKPAQEPAAEDVELALRIGAYLESLAAGQPATASEIAEALHGSDYTLEQVIEAYRVSEQLREARILIRGLDGYGYRLGVKANGG